MNLLTDRTKSNSVATAIAVLKSSSIAARNFTRRPAISSPAAAAAASPARRSREGRRKNDVPVIRSKRANSRSKASIAFALSCSGSSPKWIGLR